MLFFIYFLNHLIVVILIIAIAPSANTLTAGPMRKSAHVTCMLHASNRQKHALGNMHVKRMLQSFSTLM